MAHTVLTITIPNYTSLGQINRETHFYLFTAIYKKLTLAAYVTLSNLTIFSSTGCCQLSVLHWWRIKYNQNIIGKPTQYCEI